MGKKNISTLALLIKADPTGIAGGLAKARSMLTGFSSSLAGAIKGGAQGALDSFNQLLDSPTKLLGDVARKVPIIGDLLALPFEGASFVMGEYAKGAKTIDELGKAAARTGMDIADYQVLAEAAGDSTEAMEKAMFKLNVKMGEAALGGEEAKKAFKSLGLDAVALQAKAPLERFKDIADRFKDLKGSGLDAKLAFDLVGKSGGALLPLFQKGGEGIDKAFARLSGVGGLVSAQDLANVRKAQEAFKEIAAFKNALTTQITIGVAPFLAAMMDRFGSLGLTAKGVADWVFDAIARVGDIATEAIDSWGGFDGIITGTKDLLLGLAKGFLVMMETLSWAVEKVIELAKGAAGFGARLAIGGVLGGKVGEMFDGPQSDKKAMGASDIFKSLREKFFGGDRQKAGGGFWLTDMLGLPNLSGALDGPLQKMWRQLTAAAEGRRNGEAEKGGAFGALNASAVARAAPILKSLEGPLDHFNEQMKTLKSAAEAANAASKAAGLEGKAADPLALEDDAFFRASADAFMKLDAAYMHEQKAPGAAMEGTREAYSAIAAFSREQDRDPQARIEAILREQAERQKLQVELGRRVADAMDKLRAGGF